MFAVQRLQVGEVLLEDVDVGLQERLAERLEEEGGGGGGGVTRVIVSTRKVAGDGASPDLHGGGELRLVFHVVFRQPSLDARQDRRFEEVPPVLMQYLVQELKHLRLDVGRGPLSTARETR